MNFIFREVLEEIFLILIQTFIFSEVLVEIFLILPNSIKLLFSVRRGDVLSAWAGIRPLVKDPNATDTQSLVRNHVIHVSDR